MTHHQHPSEIETIHHPFFTMHVRYVQLSITRLYTYDSKFSADCIALIVSNVVLCFISPSSGPNTPPEWSELASPAFHEHDNVADEAADAVGPESSAPGGGAPPGDVSVLERDPAVAHHYRHRDEPDAVRNLFGVQRESAALEFGVSASAAATPARLPAFRPFAGPPALAPQRLERQLIVRRVRRHLSVEHGALAAAQQPLRLPVHEPGAAAHEHSGLRRSLTIVADYDASPVRPSTPFRAIDMFHASAAGAQDNEMECIARLRSIFECTICFQVRPEQMIEYPCGQHTSCLSCAIRWNHAQERCVQNAPLFHPSQRIPEVSQLSRKLVCMQCRDSADAAFNVDSIRFVDATVCATVCSLLQIHTFACDGCAHLSLSLEVAREHVRDCWPTWFPCRFLDSNRKPCRTSRVKNARFHSLHECMTFSCGVCLYNEPPGHCVDATLTRVWEHMRTGESHSP